jgi:DNA-binding beta-propeller fold protein YncE
MHSIMFNNLRRLAALSLCFFCFSFVLADPPSFLQLQQDVPLTGGTSRFDGQAFDPDTGTLFIAHMGAGQIIAYNTKDGRVDAILAGYPGVTGLLYVSELHYLYASVTRLHQVAVIDTRRLREVARIPAGNFPDGMAYVPDTHELYVSDEIGGEETVIDVVKNRRVASLPAGGQVGNTRYDPNSHLVWVNGQARNELIAIDPRTRKIVNRYPLHGGRHPHGLYLDSNSHLAFIGCDGDAKLLVMDLNSFQEIGVSDVGKEPDMLTFDPQLGYLYVASESGVVSLFRIRDRKIEKLGDFPVGRDAHTVEVDPQTHFVYFPLPKVNKGPVLRIMKPAD